MGIPFNLTSVHQVASQAREYFFLNMLSWAIAGQIILVGGVLLIAFRQPKSSSPQMPLEDMQIIYAVFAGSVIR